MAATSEVTMDGEFFKRTVKGARIAGLKEALAIADNSGGMIGISARAIRARIAELETDSHPHANVVGE